jgi:hypothetical protein
MLTTLHSRAGGVAEESLPTSHDEHPPYTAHWASYYWKIPTAPWRSHVRACVLPGVKVPRIAPALLIACGAHHA